MLLSEQFYQTEKTGYLNEQFRLFHLKDQTRKEFSYHYHDFHKVVIFISGKAAYHIEGKAYQLKPWDILLVNRHACLLYTSICIQNCNCIIQIISIDCERNILSARTSDRLQDHIYINILLRKGIK